MGVEAKIKTKIFNLTPMPHGGESLERRVLKSTLSLALSQAWERGFFLS